MFSEFHTELFRVFNSFSGLHLVVDSILFSLANVTGVILFLLIIALVFFRERNMRRSFQLLAHILIPVFIAILYKEILKTLIQEPRPWVVLEDVRIMFEYGGLDSFPSGHATTYSALALSAFFYNKRIGLLFGLIALGISLSRIVVGIHWPFDIVAGFAIGLSVAYLYWLFTRKKVVFLQEGEGEGLPCKKVLSEYNER